MGERAKNREPVKLSHGPSCPKPAAKRLHGESGCWLDPRDLLPATISSATGEAKYLEWNVGRELTLFYLSKAREDLDAGRVDSEALAQVKAMHARLTQVLQQYAGLGLELVQLRRKR